MKKLLLILLTVMMGIGSLTLSAQNTLTVADGTTSNSYVPVYGLYVDEYLRCQTIYPAGMIDAAATTTGMNGGSITGLTYYVNSAASASWGSAVFVVKIKEVAATTLSAFLDMADATTVYTGSLDGTQSTMDITFTTPYTYQGGNLLIEVYSTAVGTYKSASFYGVTSTGASWQGYSSSGWSSITGSAQSFIPKTTFTFTGGSEITCRPVQNLAVVDAQTTSNSLTLTWTDALNTGATYTVYNMADNTVVQSGIAGTTYTVNNLNSNTEYTFGVEANCSATDASVMMTISGRTACDAISVLPFTEDFEAVPAGSYPMPYCWSRYTSEYTCTAQYPYSYSSTAYAHGGSRSIYLFGTTGTTYPDTMVSILPALDVTLFPMNGNRLTFWARMGAASNSKNVYVGTMTNPADMSTFSLVESVTVSGNTYTLFSVPLTTASEAAPYVALMVLKGTGTMYIDDVTLEVLPACLEVSNVAANGITANSVTLTWVDNQNTDASYSIYIADSLVGTSTTTTYTVTGLESNTEYTFGVVSNCANGDGNAMTVSARTACEAMALPWTCGFEAAELQSTSQATALPWCSFRCSSTATNPNYPYSYSYSSSHSGSRSLYYYGTTSTSYPDTMAFVLPEVDVTTFPMDNNRISFWGKSSSSSYDKVVYVYTMTNPADFNTAALIDSVVVTGTTFTKYTVQLTTATATAPYVAVMCRRGSGTLYIDDMTLEVLPACLEVVSASVTATTENTIALSWVPNSDNTSATFTIYNMADSSVVADNLTGTTYTVDNLSANTQYTFGVQANCPAGDAVIVTVSGRTDCGVMALPFTENFSASLSTDPCWTGATGITAAEVFAGATLTTGTISAGYWNFSTTQNGFNDGHYYNNIYGSSRKAWMITPAIDLTTATTAQLSFDMALTAYSGTMQQPAPYTGGQKFMVIVSADGGNTWLENNATVWMRADSNANYAFEDIPYDHYGNYVINLNQYVGQTIKIAFYGESTVSGGDNDFHIDNIAVTEVPTCPNVTGVTLDGTTASTAEIHWNGNGSAGYEVQVTQNGVVVTDATVSVTDTTAVISGLTVDNDYQVEVRSICGSDYGQWSNPLSIHIGYCTPNPTSVDGSGIASVSFGGMTNTTHPTSPGFADYTSMSGTVSAGLPATVEITYATGYTYGTIIWVDWNNSLSFEGDEVVYAGVSESTNPTTLVATFDVPATTPMGSYRMRILGADSYFDNYTGSLAAAANANPCASYTWGVAEDYTLTVGAAPSCLPVTNLTVSDVTSSVVSLTWTDENNTGATYTVYNMADSSVVASGISTTNYDVTGLAASTSYIFGVVTNCSATDASGFVTVDATTECLGGNCQISIVGVDSWGDGWNGNAINVIQNGVTIGTFTIASGSSNTETYSVCSSYPVSFSWVLGSYPGETSFDILINGSFAAYSGSGSDLNDGEVFFTLTEPCPSCMPVADLNVNNATENSITISWTGSAASYDVYKDGVFVANVTTTTYTFNGLAATTAYTLGVQAICSATDSASIVTVEASTSCPDVTTLPYNEGFENGLGCWMTINASADGQPWSVNNCASLSTVDPHGGAYVASSWSWSSSAMHANAWLISPKFVLPNATDSLSFSWWEITNPSYHDSYSVVLSTTTNDTAAFTTVLRPYDTAAGTWTMQTVDLTPYAGQSVYIAFHHVDYNENYLLIDDIALYQGTYSAPDSLTINLSINNPALGSINPLPGVYHVALNDSLVLSATPAAGATFDGWKISVGTQTMGTIPINPFTFPVNPNNIAFGELNVVAMFSDSTSAPDSMTVIINTADATMGTTNPAPGTYNFAVGSQTFVTAIPNDGYQLLYWIESMTVGDMTVTDTLIADTIIVNVIPIMAGITSSLTAYFEANAGEPCETPTGLTYGEVTSESIAVSWDNADVASWNVRYRPQNGTWTSATATTNSYNITGLAPQTTYEIQVQANCGNGNLSEWSSSIVVTTTVGIDSWLESSVSLYPNPAREYVDIRVDGDLNVKMMEVYDVYGKLINTVTVTENPTRINVSSLANGMYFVRVSTEAGMVTKTFVKR